MKEPDAPPLLLDITSETCPMTFVRTRLALDGLPAGSLLRVTLRGEEPLKNVSRSTLSLGHTILSTEEEKEGDHYILTIRKKDEG
ncbi:sulfurtransferase TusA family protein [Acetobacter sp.]|jgi:TusA-related sulfurtransferase|uniref:sulfurtransferase TusA family protein n=1 Tax=Acetobacter sp. TaxID=440 RepID=UPI0025C17BC0|nr:sulfurtransferase TusA family protein [Acetobacter sp.]MCH4092277.1 sulfurtransferase TusA family protein [Acetobacter sp.]MCI1299806.1 sulfurtransferase TusA family protein [Acetobacter sp.]MCI1315824.1 sulfurtransferase TusA family protein [Acetobacter sp.]